MARHEAARPPPRSLPPRTRPSRLGSPTAPTTTRPRNARAWASYAARFSSLRGKPSTRKVAGTPPAAASASAMAACSREMVTREGTICPFLIMAATISPSGVPPAMCARSKSPADRCTTPNSFTRREHCGREGGVRGLGGIGWANGQGLGGLGAGTRFGLRAVPQDPRHPPPLACVPLPDPGPPSTKTTVRVEAAGAAGADRARSGGAACSGRGG